MTRQELGARIREARQGRLGMTQEQFARELGYAPGPYNQNLISQIEAGRIPVPKSHLLKLSALTGIPLSDLLQ